VIRLSDSETGAADAWQIRGDGSPGAATASLVLDGLTVGGRGIIAIEYSGKLDVRHCTLVPGWVPGSERSARHLDAASLTFDNCTCSVAVVASILGPIFVQADERIEDPLPISLCDSIVDAGEDRDAFVSSGAAPYVSLSTRRCTVFGAVAAHAMSLAENSIFTDPVVVARRGAGCMRFCALPLDSRTPRRVACAPGGGEDSGLRPIFMSTAYGAVDYAVLAPACPSSIARGADDRSEMGVYHDQFRPQRDANLRAALDEYLPAGVSVGITYLD
jgi:hypothetical protein